MYSILIIFLFVFLAVLTAGLAVYYVIASDKKTYDSEKDIIKNENISQNYRFSVPQNYLGKACIFLIFIAQIVLILPFALAFNRLKFFVFAEVGIFLFFMILCLWYSLQKNMLRFKE